MNSISSFTGEYSFLSNFFMKEIQIEGKLYPSVEHAFQAMKTTDEDEQEAIKNCTTPGRAKRLGRKVKLRDNWEDIKVSIMKNIIEVKFSDVFLMEKLLSTLDKTLIEGNH